MKKIQHIHFDACHDEEIELSSVVEFGGKKTLKQCLEEHHYPALITFRDLEGNTVTVHLCPEQFRQLRDDLNLFRGNPRYEMSYGPPVEIKKVNQR